MEQKVVKIEIGKLLAIIIAIVVLAVAAMVFANGSYFQGKVLREDTLKEVISTDDSSVVTKEKMTPASTKDKELAPVYTEEDILKALPEDEAAVIFEPVYTEADMAKAVYEEPTSEITNNDMDAVTAEKELVPVYTDAAKDMEAVTFEKEAITLDAKSL